MGPAHIKSEQIRHETHTGTNCEHIKAQICTIATRCVDYQAGLRAFLEYPISPHAHAPTKYTNICIWKPYALQPAPQKFHATMPKEISTLKHWHMYYTGAACTQAGASVLQGVAHVGPHPQQIVPAVPALAPTTSATRL